MPNYSKRDIILVRYPFSDLSSSKVRPAVIVSAPPEKGGMLGSLASLDRGGTTTRANLFAYKNLG
jgi:hypothetical protein